MPYVGDNAADEFVFVTSKVVATRATSLSRSDSGNSSPQASRRRLHLQPIPTNIDPQQPSPTDHRQKAFATSISSVTKATPLPLELIELLPQHLRENAIRKLTRSTHPLPELSPHLVSKESSPPERPPLPANYYSGDYSNILDKHDSNTGQEPEHNYDYLTDLVTSDALAVLGRSTAPSSRASSVTPASIPSSIKTSHAPHHTAPAALGISSDSGISSGSSCSSSSSSSVSSRSSSSKSLPRAGSKASLNGRPLEPPASPKFCRGGISASAGNGGATSVSNSGSDLSHTKVSLTAVLASDGERASMFPRLETSTPAKSSLLDSFRAGSSQPSPHGSPRPVQKHVAIATITTMGMTHPKYTQHTTTTAPQPQQAKVTGSQPHLVQQPSNNPTSPSKDAQRQRTSRTPTISTVKPTKSILKDERCSILGHTVVSQPQASRAQQPLPIQVQPLPIQMQPVSQTSTGSVSKHISNRSAPSSPEMRRAWNQVGIPTQVSSQKVSSPRALPRTRGCNMSPAAGRTSPAAGRDSPAAGRASPAGGRASPAAGRASRSPSPHTDAIYDNVVPSKSGTGSGTFLVNSRPTASVIPLATHCAPQYIPIMSNTATSSGTPPPARRILTPATPVMITKPPSPPTQRRNTRSTTPTGAGAGSACPPPMGPMLHYYTPGDQKYPGGYWAPVWGSSPQLCSQGPQGPAPCYTTYVCGHGGPPAAHGSGGYPVAMMCDGRSHSCERLPPGVSAPNSPLSGRRSASPWRGGSASPIMARHSPSPEPGGAGRPPRPRRPPAMRKSKTVEVAYLDLHPMSSGVPTVPGYANPIFAGAQSPARAATPPAFIGHHYPYAHPSSFNIHASPYVPPLQLQHQGHHHPHPGYLHQQRDPRTSSPTPSVTSVMSMSSHHSTAVPPGQQSFPVAKEKVTYKRFYKCMKSFLKPAQAQ